MIESIQRLLENITPSANPLLVTVFGDSIAPRGGDIWLGELITLMAPFGISERQVRTGVFRLARDGWLMRIPHGRKSRYAITKNALQIFAAAGRRVYTSKASKWNGSWLLAHLSSHLTSSHRSALRQELRYAGFGELSTHFLLRPNTGVDISDLKSLIDRAKAPSHVVFFDGKLSTIDPALDERTMAINAWDLSALNASYERYLSNFSPFTEQPPSDPKNCFILQTLMIHQYRRILLKDPHLPSEVLPSQWAGSTARHLTANLYHKLNAGSDAYLSTVLSKINEPHADFMMTNRFVST